MSRLTLEGVLCGRGYADLPASPLQIAIARAADGRPLDGVIGSDACMRHFGVHELPATKPTIIELVCGVRAGKSFIAACAAIHAALTCDLSSLKAHEVARGAIVAPRIDAARATFVILLGILQSSTVLRAFIDGDPTNDTVVIKRPDGRRVELVVVAASRGGVTMRGRWLYYYALEELAQFGAELEGASITAEDIHHAAQTRLLPGCQGWLISSPFGPQGLLYDLYTEHFGKPGRYLVVHAPTQALNPSFPTEQIAAVRASNPDVAAREHDAEWLDADTAYYAGVQIDKCTRAAPYVRGCPARIYPVAAMDPGTRANSWTLAVAWAEALNTPEWWRPLDERLTERHRVVVAGAWQWTGSKSKPLDPRVVLAEIAAILTGYRVTVLHTDQWSFDALNSLANEVGLMLSQPSYTPSGTISAAADREVHWHHLKTLLNAGDIELPPHPVMRSDLLSVRQRATSGGTKIVLPRTANGRHADFAPSVALAAYYARRMDTKPFQYIAKARF